MNMTPETYWYLLAGSMAGGLNGMLVMWNRKHLQAAAGNHPQAFAVLALGTAASAGSLWAFSKAFGAGSPTYAAIAVMTITSWAAVLGPMLRTWVPRSWLRVRAGEFAVLRVRWTGVRLFGTLLRRTPLRHLGGRVYLSGEGRDPQVVLGGIHDAEVVHLVAVLLSCPWLGAWAMQGRWLSIVSGLAVHVPLNFYPILHLRLTTWRMERYVVTSRRGAKGP